MSAKQLAQLGTDLWKTRTDKVAAETFTLTYGALVVQLLRDYEDYHLVNAQLERMGYNIGTRLIEDFLARSGLPRCSDFAMVGQVVAKVGFKMFLNVSPGVGMVANPTPTTAGAVVGGSAAAAAAAAADGASSASTAAGSNAGNGGQGSTAAPQNIQEFALTLDENPLAEFVELPPDARAKGLWFSNVLCGVIRGALEMVQMQTEAYFVSDTLRGDDTTEIRVRLIRTLDEEGPIADD
ncbi:unnamed protein product [Tilletia laevis]|uniref:Trafficking protein particle complex subunit BET3 n=2 Tax=Tilletia TaxID=13289 RepID=A0A177U4Q6_9BASI|nr:hypothetical protein CF336_g3708 [Tilletia laevis]KAE8261649.1 hypothetical protein A4X03_0g3079 [Tilletia caries]KAE8203683.1 hypothetical protein CF335_g2925 [Tilletia laevis]CAD6893308.1 unnamed protein product [Tilletia caries]CAD6900167.1 unnamed protein product [Tilletia laevis]